MALRDEDIHAMLENKNLRTLELYGECVVYRKWKSVYEYLFLHWKGVTVPNIPDGPIPVPLKPPEGTQPCGGLTLLARTLQQTLLKEASLEVGDMRLEGDWTDFDPFTEIKTHFYYFSAPFVGWRGSTSTIRGLAKDPGWYTFAQLSGPDMHLPEFVVEDIEKIDTRLRNERAAKQAVRRTQN